MKLIYIAAVLFFASQLGHAAEIGGRVRNASQDSVSVPGMKIFLLQVTQNAQAPTQAAETVSDRSGSFRFGVDAVDAASTYYASTDFQGVRYFSDGLVLTADQSLNMTLVVHDSTHSAKGVDAFMHHIIIDDLGGSLQFRETHVLNNPSGQTITQTLRDETVGPALFKFRLPAGATNFTPISAHSAEEMVREGEFVYDRTIFLPGQKTISFAYEIPIAQKTAHIHANAAHDARTFDVFIGSENLTVESNQLEDYGMFSISGTQYHRYGASNVDAGTDIAFSVMRSGGSMPKQTPALALVLTSALLLIGLFESRIKKKKNAAPTKVSDGDASSRREQLINEIARLDAAGKPNSEGLRSRLMNELQTIEWQRRNVTKKARHKK